MEIRQNYDLTKLNTFGITARAKFFLEVSTEDELKKLFAEPVFKNNPRLFLGGGSNLLFTRDFDGLVVQNRLKGIEIIEENSEHALVRAMGGEIWHDLVLFAIEHGLWGIENLSSIPGSVGAAPVQNIGAYGAELREVLYSIEALDIEAGEKKVFTNDSYAGGYRESIFKNELKGKYFITAVTLKLSKIPKKNLSYKSLREYLGARGVRDPSLQEISAAVTEIRKEKLPDPRFIANAGSFFKNVFVDEAKLAELLKVYPSMPYFKVGEGIKIPSAWLIEECSWKGKRMGDAGVYERHALVLVNHGKATGEEIKKLSDEIIASVREKFGIELSPEVNFI
ncbi:MAG: UDP-N-acetylmuramate dehydrogenase [Patescibacteria group bacterium]